MNELVNVPISPWYTIPAAVGLLALTFALLPGLFLHLGVLIYPKSHARRQEFTAELYCIPFVKRPLWVASTLVRCLFEGVPARAQSIRLRRHKRTTPFSAGWEVGRLDSEIRAMAQQDIDVKGWHRYTPQRISYRANLRRLRKKVRRLVKYARDAGWTE